MLKVACELVCRCNRVKKAEKWGGGSQESQGNIEIHVTNG